MVLRDVKRVLAARGTATLSQIVYELGADRDTVAAALEFWLRRGNVSMDSGGLTSGRAAPGGAAPDESCRTACRGCPLVPLCSPRSAPEDRPSHAAAPPPVFHWRPTVFSR